MAVDFTGWTPFGISHLAAYFMPVKTILGIASVIICLFGYGWYIRDIFRGRTRPHVFTWFVWSLLMGLAFFAQTSKGGGAGAWATAVTAVISLFIAACALWRGERHITWTDWLCFVGSLAGLGFWKMTAEPLAAIVTIMTVDALAFIPTFRKSYSKPFEETEGVYVASIIKHVLSLSALGSYSLTTWLYPAYLVVNNTIFVLMLQARRRSLKRRAGN